MNIFQHPDVVHVAAMLEANQLPTADLSELNPDHFLGCGEPSNPMGVIGLEMFEDVGLLRSLVVDRRARGQGCGKALVQSLETFAKENNIRTMYLLTETAEGYFASLGYAKIERLNAPDSIKHTREFSGLCPEDAILMGKEL